MIVLITYTRRFRAKKQKNKTRAIDYIGTGIFTAFFSLYPRVIIIIARFMISSAVLDKGKQQKREREKKTRTEIESNEREFQS